MKKIILPALAFLALTAFTTVSLDNNDSQGVTLWANMTGAQEAPVMGDPDGTGYAELVLNSGQGTVSYTINVSNIDAPTAAHVHIAPPGSAGPVVIPLSAPVNGMISGTVEVDKDLIKEIRKNPSAYYINVHNAPYPGGAVRGQLSK